MKRRKKIRKHWKQNNFEVAENKDTGNSTNNSTPFPNGMTADEFDKWLDYLELNNMAAYNAYMCGEWDGTGEYQGNTSNANACSTI